MANLFCFGLGYSAEHYVAAFGAGYERVAGTIRTSEKTAALATRGFAGRAVEAFIFDRQHASAKISASLAETDFLLVSAAPDAAGDPVLAVYADALVQAKRLRCVVYLANGG